MKPICTISFSSFIAMAALSFTVTGNDNIDNAPADTNKGFAVVELFTSEGCSSCPPADDAAIKLAAEFPDRVYFLGFHVDYWDYIGWKDEYAKASYTERQRKYGEIFHLKSIYTPQAVVNGEKELVGSKENQLRAIIKEQLNESSSASIELTGKKAGEKNITAFYTATNAGKSVLHIALVQLKGVTNVKRGENGGHKLNHINIVRDFKTIELNKELKGTAEFTIPKGLSAMELKVIAYIQDKNSGKIIAASASIIQ
jgi:hypothetical protein